MMHDTRYCCTAKLLIHSCILSAFHVHEWESQVTA